MHTLIPIIKFLNVKKEVSIGKIKINRLKKLFERNFKKFVFLQLPTILCYINYSLSIS